MVQNKKHNFIKKISGLKLAGIKRFVIVDIYKDYVNLLYMRVKEPLYDIGSALSFSNCHNLAYEKINYSGEITEITSIIKKFVQKYEITDSYLLVGLNEYRTKTIPVSKDEEDIELWFQENADKFIPAGRAKDEFIFTYEKYKEDDENNYFIVIISRNDFIKRITETCEKTGLRLLSISPLHFGFLSLPSINDKLALFVDISIDTIRYIFSDINDNLFSGELYHNIFKKEGLAEYQIDLKELNSELEKIRETITLSLNGTKIDELQLFLSAETIYFPSIKQQAVQIFQPQNVNEGLKGIVTSMPGAYFRLFTEYNNTESKINLLNSEKLEKEINELDKKAGLRITLACGALLIVLLLFLYFIEGAISSRIAEGEDKLVEVNAKTNVIEKMKDDNSKLESNLGMLKKLRGTNVVYSNLLKDFSQVVTSRSLFTGMKLTEPSSGFISVELDGFAYDQQEVADIIRNMERSDSFTKVALLYSDLADSKNSKQIPSGFSKVPIKFKVSAEYHAD